MLSERLRRYTEDGTKLPADLHAALVDAVEFIEAYEWLEAVTLRDYGKTLNELGAHIAVAVAPEPRLFKLVQTWSKSR